ncbi:bifunctional farnesyl-diphosphate farnesyltransferase/squalene synthase [Tulasnella sp. JGI-2019a]|nr:bifunctional farnesyl-diphosphate farnesyltransferase/squalene synthase [Tulasnella sp. JGI-2019a]KAG8999323.1 bifunctional farnesyl-diphosphate farnesyltransferase/squalene synthase [Tulasnella sp. JGI-2019a]
MGAIDYVLLALTHPIEFRSLIQFSLWYERKRDITAVREHATSGWDRESMRECWMFLDRTGRGYSAVIKELEGDLARTVCLFYLALRGLDTVKDDMTIPDDKKQPILRSFHQKLTKPGWTFTECGPSEKDRDLLCRFDGVISELGLLEKASCDIIIDICVKMGRGMADFAHKAATAKSDEELSVPTIEEYDLYCHYVAGLVGEGLSRLFVATGKEQSWLADQLVLSNSIGLLLQKVNIIRDVAEDARDGRYFWPREIWGRYGFQHVRELTSTAVSPSSAGDANQRALWALSGMILDALRHVVDSLNYLTLLKNQSVFNFCAIPCVMALATLDACFMNPKVLNQNVKIRKGQAVQLIMKSANPRDVAYLCRDFVRSIHTKAAPADPNFMKISITCGRVEQWVEHHYPSIIHVTTPNLEPGTSRAQVSPTQTDARVRILNREMKMHSLQKIKDMGLGKETQSFQQEMLPGELYAVVFGGFLVTTLVGCALVFAVLYFTSDWLT